MHCLDNIVAMPTLKHVPFSLLIRTPHDNSKAISTTREQLLLQKDPEETP